MWQDNRSTEPELLDLGNAHYSQNEYTSCLRYLQKINVLLGGFRATKRALNSLDRPPDSILEIGCGGGYLCQRMHRWFPNASILGVDISDAAIAHAKSHLPDSDRKRVIFEEQESKKLKYPDNSFDVVTTMLVCHHMTDDELIFFLQESYRICKKAVVINDLQRHLLAYLSFSCIAPILFPNRLIWHDGRLSIRRSFRQEDWVLLLEKAGFAKDQYALKWNPAFRWTLTIRKL